MTRQQQRIGKYGEGQAAGALHRVGVEMVERIATPVITNGTRIIAYGERVSGDHRGILPGGRSVLAETKTILDRNLRYSDLREHQPERLARHAEHGGLSLLVWVHHSGVYVIKFPIAGFERGKSLTIEQARKLQIEVIA